MCIMYSLCTKARIKKKWSYVVWGVVIYAFVFGLRHGVGTDFHSYYEAFVELQKGKEPDTNFDSGFLLFMKAIVHIGLPRLFYFGSIAFIQLYLIFKALKKEYYVWPYIAITFFLNCEWLAFANTIRQVLAFAIFAFAINYAIEKKLVQYIFAIAVASCLHKSALMLLPLYPILNGEKQYFKNILLEYILFVVALVLNQFGAVMYVLVYLPSIMQITGYSSYMYDTFINQVIREVNVGLGYYIGIVINLILIGYSNKVKDFVRSQTVNIVYDLYFVGVLANYIFLTSRIIQRVFLYFFGFAFVIGAYTLFYFKKRNKRMFYVLLFLYLLIFIGYMMGMEYNSTAFHFMWEDNLK